MLERVLEPEVMDTVAEAVDYNSMDHSHVNRVFVDDLLVELVQDAKGVRVPLRILDAGTGTALIPLEMMSRGMGVDITAVDLAEQMLIVGRENVRAAGHAESIKLVLADCKRLPDADATYDVVMSNSIVHHIHEPRLVLAEMWRVLRSGGLLFVRDLMRPENLAQLDHLVMTYAAGANSHQKKMFRDSLHAALTTDEVNELLIQAGISNSAVKATSDRHWTIVARK